MRLRKRTFKIQLNSLADTQGCNNMRTISMLYVAVFVHALVALVSNNAKASAKTTIRQQVYYAQRSPPAYPPVYRPRYPPQYARQNPARYQQRYPPRYSYGPRYVVRPPPPYQGPKSSGLDLQTLSLVLILRRFLSRDETTTESTAISTTTQSTTTTTTTTTASTTMEDTSTATTTTTTTTTTTQDPFAGWVDHKTCRYYVSSDVRTWEAANTRCDELITGAILVAAGFNKATAERDALIAELGISSRSYWIGSTAEGVANVGDEPNNAVWLDPIPGGPEDATADLEVEDIIGGTVAKVCGRFLAGSSPDTVFYEGCTSESFYYVCEYCGSTDTP